MPAATLALPDVLAALEAAGSEQTRKTYARHGTPQPMFGVSYAELEKLRKRIKRDPALAAELWATGNADARVLACMIADPAAIPASWAAEVDHKALAAAFSDLAGKAPDATTRAMGWLADPALAGLGWRVVAYLATKVPATPDAFFAPLLPRLEAEIHTAPNAMRDGLNWALIAIGGRSDALAEPATAAARRIGKVEVDHGDTCCKTPDAAGYIAKMRARSRK